ncbi:MAG: hypothetical protein PHO65_04355 [Sulfurovum sp.]|nr:hypothetical protein [Sulfurovum sp.]
MKELLSQIFKKNRAEEFPDDLWNNFVLPIDYEQHNLLTNAKGIKVEGGRGTGKTMFLKYHCFPTQLSPKRTDIKDIDNIGIYWRPDTHFVQLINKNYLGDKWGAVFNTYIGLSLLIKFSEFIQQLIKSNYKDASLKKELQKLLIPIFLTEELKAAETTLYLELARHCHGLKYKLQNWLNNPSKEPPILIDGKASLEYVIQDIKGQGLLTNTSYHIFIDEFENLREEQQIIINDWMKHGEQPLLYSIAYKKFAKISHDTSGVESTQRRNDHRIVDLINDVYARDEYSFKVFAAEIIVSKLQEFLPNLQLINKNIISDIEKLHTRRDSMYQRDMLKIANIVFPELTYSEIAEQILNDVTLNSRIQKNIEQALKEKKSTLKSNVFIDINFPDASLVNSILLYRKKTVPSQLQKTFEEYKLNPNSKEKIIAQYKEQISNNIVGSILYIYTSYPQRICPIYSGFNRFYSMSKNNLRHLLELCYQSFVELESSTQNLENLKESLPIVPIESQLKAAKFCSKQELDTISELGPYGQDLQKIANRLGRIFYLKQRIRTQSKPENIHFSVETLALNSIDEKINILINQAMLWNVLQEYESTKGTADNISTKEYMLTPMLAPFYKITPRKIHKIVFSVENLKTIFLEDDEKFDNYYNRLIKEWKIDDEPELIQKSLFGDEF